MSTVKLRMLVRLTLRHLCSFRSKLKVGSDYFAFSKLLAACMEEPYLYVVSGPILLDTLS